MQPLKKKHNRKTHQFQNSPRIPQSKANIASLRDFNGGRPTASHLQNKKSVLRKLTKLYGENACHLVGDFILL
ncbi:MAG: hypothetical protein FWE13_02225 [Firmicutes bacterium]|nr:hypothetical protein [Bacillota bacterium]